MLRTLLVILLVALAVSAHDAGPLLEDTVVPESTPPEDLLAVRAATVQEIVNRHFAGLDAGSTLPNLESRHPMEVAHTLCRQPAANIDHILKNLGIDQYCNKETGSAKDNQSCKAIYAAKAAFAELEREFPEGPAFRNYLPVDWTASEEQLFPTCKVGTMGPLRVPEDGTPPTAKFNTGQGNGCNSFGLCSIIVTTLMQVNDQSSTGTCGPQAMFAAVGILRPARAIKIATELLWSGTYHQFVAPTCAGVQVYQPGLIPYESGQPGCGCQGPKCHEAQGKTGFRCAKKACSGNSNDCKGAIENRPYQVAGLSVMISEAFLSSIYHKITGNCDEQQGGIQMLYGASTQAKNIENAQGTTAGHLMELCKGMIGKGVQCAYLKNTAKCPPIHTDCAALSKLSMLGQVTPTDVASMEAYANGEPSPRLTPRGKQALSDVATVIGGQDKLKSFVKYFQRPNFTPELLTQACASLPAVVYVDANALKTIEGVDGKHYRGQPLADAADAKCDHWITLTKCDIENDKYMMWSWGFTWTFTKSSIVGIGKADPHGFTDRGSVCAMIAVPPIV